MLPPQSTGGSFAEPAAAEAYGGGGRGGLRLGGAVMRKARRWIGALVGALVGFAVLAPFEDGAANAGREACPEGLLGSVHDFFRGVHHEITSGLGEVVERLWRDGMRGSCAGRAGSRAPSRWSAFAAKALLRFFFVGNRCM